MIGNDAGGSTRLLVKYGKRKLKLESVTVAQWTVANTRIMHRLISSKQFVSYDDLKSYLAYTVKVMQLCTRYTWVSILRFDDEFRQLQAFYQVPWTYAGINLTGYHPPGLTPRPLIFSVKIPVPGTAFQCKPPAPGSKNETKIPTPGHNLPSSNAKRSMKKEHNSIKAVSFQIFHNCPFDNFLFLVRIKYSQVFIQHLRLILFEVLRQFENHCQCGKPRYSSVTTLTCPIHIFLGFSAD